MNNPYSVLGVSENAGVEEIKQAYRTLARKYHAEYNEGSPLSDVAKQKMDELDKAYDEIMAQRSGNYNSQNNSNAYNAYNSPHSTQYGDVRQQINSGRIDDAQTILDGIPADMRDAEWYYLKGLIHQKRGWFDEAYSNYSQACQMDPSNAEYSNAFNSLNRNANGGYRQTGGSPSGACGACVVCTGLMCADCCCECFGGDLIPCC